MKRTIPRYMLFGFAERKGIVRNPTGLKRALVAQKINKPEVAPAGSSVGGGETGQQSSNSGQVPESSADAAMAARAAIETAANEDVRDMRLGLHAARMALSFSPHSVAQAHVSLDKTRT